METAEEVVNMPRLILIKRSNTRSIRLNELGAIGKLLGYEVQELEAKDPFRELPEKLEFLGASIFKGWDGKTLPIVIFQDKELLLFVAGKELSILRWALINTEAYARVGELAKRLELKRASIEYGRETFRILKQFRLIRELRGLE